MTILFEVMNSTKTNWNWTVKINFDSLFQVFLLPPVPHYKIQLPEYKFMLNHKNFSVFKRNLFYYLKILQSFKKLWDQKWIMEDEMFKQGLKSYFPKLGFTSWGYPALPRNATCDFLYWFAPNVCFDRGCMIVLKNWKLQPN